MSGIIKAPPVIDANVDFEITKDGSDLVSALRNKYHANVFRAKDLAKKPVENGAGMVFNENADALETVSEWKPDLIKGFSIEVDVDLSAYPLDKSDGIIFSKAEVFDIVPYRFGGATLPVLSFLLYIESGSQYYCSIGYPVGRVKFVFQVRHVGANVIIQAFADDLLVYVYSSDYTNEVKDSPFGTFSVGGLDTIGSIYGVKIVPGLIYSNEPFVRRPNAFMSDALYLSDTEGYFEAGMQLPPSAITEFGFVYGKTVPITIENSTCVKMESGDPGYFSLTVYDLVNATSEKYYVRAYFIGEEEGLSYGSYLELHEYVDEG